MKKLLVTTFVFLSFFFLMGCEEDALDAHGELVAVLTVTPDHVHTLAETTFTAVITDHHGDAVTDFLKVEVQRKFHTEDQWRSTELTLDGTVYKGNYTFFTSGEYDIRLAVLRHGEIEMEILYVMTDHFHVGRAHEELNGYRIEYEHYPGHIHEGDQATIKFWVMEAQADANGVRPPVSGLSPLITCTHFDGTTEVHTNVTESESGVYQITHTFVVAGDAFEKIEFTGANNTVTTAKFDFEVAHGH